MSDADAIETSVARIAGIGFSSRPSLSPDGKNLVFISDVGGSPQIWKADTATKKTEQVTALENPVQFVSWSPDGHWLAFSFAPGGGMNTQIALVRPDGSDFRRITDGAKETNMLGPWSDDSSILGYSSNRRTGSSSDVYLYDLVSSDHKILAQPEGLNYLTDISGNGRYGAVVRVVQRGDSELYLVDLASAQTTELAPHLGPSYFFQAYFLADSTRVIFKSNVGRERVGLVVVSVSDPGSADYVAYRDNSDLEQFSVSRDRSKGVLNWNAAGWCRFSRSHLRVE